MTECRSCGAAITWVPTQSGKRMPLDAAATPTGNVAIQRRSDDSHYARVLAGADLDAYRSSGGRLYMPHHATCPHAAQHRRK